MLIDIGKNLKILYVTVQIRYPDSSHMLAPDVNGLIVLSGSGSATLQVPPDSCRLPALIHDCSLDLLSGHDCEGYRRRERGEA